MTGRGSGRKRAILDWEAIRDRIAALPSLDTEAPELSEGEVRAVLEKRARVLATPPESSQGGESLELVLLEQSAGTYAIESRFVFETFRCADISLLPGAEPPIVGITSWRGELLTLLDLRRIMGLPVSASEDPRQVLVLGETHPAFGILVEGVPSICEIPVASVHPLAESAGDGSGFLRGMTPEAVLVIAAADLIHTFS